MPFDWNITKCKDFEELQKEENWKITWSVLHHTLTTGINHITEKNYKEFYFRMRVWCGLMGSTLTDVEKKRGIVPSLNDVKNCIGAWTNANSLTKTAWEKKVRDCLFDRIRLDHNQRWLE